MKTVILSFLIFCLTVISQWTSNTNLNTLVCDTTGEQTLVKIAMCPDGSTFYTWFDNRGGSYAVYIQKLDTNGVRQFPAGGILVSNNSQSSSLVDYDLAVDAGGNAIVVFTDTRNGSVINPFAYKISPAGAMLWGANGISLTDSVNSYQPNPKVAVTSDGNYVFLWRLGQGPTKLAIQMLNSAGVKLWGTSPVIITTGTTENLDWPSLIASDNGSVILMASGYTGSFISPQNYKIYTQKVSSLGARMWSDTVVYSLGRVSGFYQPRLFSDGQNGAVYCWRDDRNSANLQTGYIQRKNSSGTSLFPLNGSPVSGNTSNNHFDPVAAYMPATGETVAFWYESNPSQNQFGVYGQKFSSNGTSLWGSDGIAFSPLGSNQPSAYNIAVKDTNAFCYYQETAGGANYIVKAFRVGKSGGFVWSGNILTPCSLPSQKLRTVAVLNPVSGMSILSWRDSRSDAGGIYAQNINFNGSFGPLLHVEPINQNVPGEFKLYQNYPNPFNPTTKIRFVISPAGAQYIEPVQLIIYDILGREAATLVNGNLKAGSYEVDFDGSNLSGSVYFYSLQAGDYTAVKKMIFLK